MFVVLKFILVFLVLAGLFFPRSKMLFGLTGLYLFLVIGFRTQDVDHYIYQVEYATAPFINYKLADFPGWNLWMNFWIKRGINFNQFLLIMAFISVVLLLVGIYIIGSKLGGYISFAMSLFLIYPLGHEATQMRTFFVDAIIVAVLPLLLKNESNLQKRLVNYLLYFLAVAVATSIHTLAYYFIVVGIIYIIAKSFKYELQTIIISSISLIFLINSGILNNLILNFLNTAKQDHWIDNNNFSLGKMVPIIITLIIWYIATVEINTIRQNVVAEEQISFINIQKFLNTIFLILPLMIYDITFNRLWRIYLLILYLIMGKYMYGLGTKFSRKRLAVIALFFVMLSIIFVYENEFNITGDLLI